MGVLSECEYKKISMGHIYYRFKDEKAYMDNIFSFIQAGIENKQQILIIENMRNLPKVQAFIDSSFIEPIKSSIRLVNNYEYYLSHGDFSTQNIVSHFAKDLSYLQKCKCTIRTWAHVEWSSSKPSEELAKEFECVADNFVKDSQILSVCAYPSARLSTGLNLVLEEFHQYVMTDGTLSLSSIYRNL
ncbi:MEDS domain-containing protein [Psychrobacillus lasiicapitis]|uniref:MEDS domain-containing protein n=1 Tax=Psychrobacillus lasiicapitis TaxID=1636719 RepID=A0A544THL3_9BACI|nr:MEDS domain-containing protein [Psychrobacillus lasiicapitis]TQR16949.1 hypothetical protein FG382_02000 [Psychrobacillus lasiicapitis]GGA25833.1 hypothetical protein GCM10011384_13800 [Psychrobacillus lasiicapitis]